MKVIQDAIVETKPLTPNSFINTVIINGNILLIDKKKRLGFYKINPNGSIHHKLLQRDYIATLPNVYVNTINFNAIQYNNETIILEYVSDSMLHHPVIIKIVKKDNKWLLDKTFVYKLNEGPSTLRANNLTIFGDSVIRLSRCVFTKTVELHSINVNTMEEQLEGTNLPYNVKYPLLLDDTNIVLKDTEYNLTEMFNMSPIKLSGRMFRKDLISLTKLSYKGNVYLLNTSNSNKHIYQKVINYKGYGEFKSILNKKQPIVPLFISAVGDDRLYRFGVIDHESSLCWSYDIK